MTANIDQIINRQIERWEKTKRLSRGVGEAVRLQRPVITISRTHGARGKRLGRMIAAALGFELYDREIAERIAESAQVRERLVETLDDKVQVRIQSQLSEQFQKGFFTSNDYLEHLSHVVVAIGQHGEAVIVGRGAQFILDRSQTLCVRITAPLEMRIRKVAQQKNISDQRARSEVLRVDAERQAYARWHFNKEIDDAGQYDLVLNTGTLALEICSKLVTDAFVGRFGEPIRPAA